MKKICISIFAVVLFSCNTHKFIGKYQSYLMKIMILNEINNSNYVRNSFCNEKYITANKKACIEEFENHNFLEDSFKLREVKNKYFSTNKDKIFLIYHGRSESVGYVFRTYYAVYSNQDKILRGFSQEKETQENEYYARSYNDFNKYFYRKSHCDNQDFIFIVELNDEYKILKMKFLNRYAIEP